MLHPFGPLHVVERVVSAATLTFSAHCNTDDAFESMPEKLAVDEFDHIRAIARVFVTVTGDEPVKNGTFLIVRVHRLQTDLAF